MKRFLRSFLTRGRAGAGACLFATAAGLVTSPSLATTGDPVLASQLFHEGREAIDKGDFDTACAKLTRSLALDVRVGTLGKLAECEERRGHVAAALARWQEAVGLARGNSDVRRSAAEAELTRLDRIVPKVAIHAVRAARGETIRVDARPLDLGEHASPVALDPGEHVVEASADGFVAWSRRVQLAPDGRVTDVEVPPLAPLNGPESPAPAPAAPSAQTQPAPLASTAAAPEEVAKPSGALRTAGLVTAAAGVVGLGVGAYFLSQAVSLNAASKREGCVGTACPSGAATDDRRTAYGDGNVATGFFISGAALAAVGGAIFVFAPHGAPRTDRALTVTPQAGARSAGIVIGGTW
jgi:hypothetical protein